MYSWGPDTTSWKKPGGYKFDSARAPYLDKLAASAAAKGPRTYVAGSEPGDAVLAKGKTIATESENPIVIGIDVTGSMTSWPGEIFDRLPLLYQTLSQYRPDVEMSFSAIGDATCDSYPLQVGSFGKGVGLEDTIKALYPEGRGGGQYSESYELFGQYMNTRCDMPNAKSPFLFIFGDEKAYNKIDPAQVEHYIGDKLQSPLEAKKMWQGLMQRFNVFYLQKPYGHGDDSGTTKEVKEYWTELLGAERVIDLPSQDRAVDVAMGIVAKYWGHFGDYKGSLSARQDDKEASKVLKSIRVIPNDPTTAGTGSIITGASGGKKSIRLDT